MHASHVLGFTQWNLIEMCTACSFSHPTTVGSLGCLVPSWEGEEEPLGSSLSARQRGEAPLRLGRWPSKNESQSLFCLEVSWQLTLFYNIEGASHHSYWSREMCSGELWPHHRTVMRNLTFSLLIPERQKHTGISRKIHEGMNGPGPGQDLAPSQP